MDDFDQQPGEPFGLIRGLAMIVGVVGLWFFLMLAIPLISCWDRIKEWKDGTDGDR